MKALCLGECYMAVELKRQHQDINESLVFGRMLWLLNLKDNIRTSMKALCLGECYMAVELKRQHQDINESLVFGRMLYGC